MPPKQELNLLEFSSRRRILAEDTKLFEAFDPGT
jgi:hypothetical protein